jgi:hypothetical protein
MKITKTNPLTGKTNEMHLNISSQEFLECNKKWKDGMMIQEAFPMLNATEREFLMTGLLPGEQDEIFKEPEE